jgi:dipeptidase
MCWPSLAQQAIRVELDARVERVEQRLDQVGQLLAETRQQQAEVTAISDEIKAWWEEGKALWQAHRLGRDESVARAAAGRCRVIQFSNSIPMRANA